MASATAADEQRHEPGSEAFWSESWYFDFMNLDGTLGGYVRLGFYPNLGTAWYWACLVGENRSLVTVIDHEVPLPRSATSLEVRSEGLWADHTVETPLDHMTLGLEAFGTSLDDPADTYGDLRGKSTPLGFDLEWETDGDTFEYPGVTRYEVPSRVHGKVLVGDERIDFDGWGQRDHSWGVRDWWSVGWSWTAGRLDDGTRFHATHVTLGDEPVYVTGYVQQPGGAMQPVTAVERTQTLGEHGFPTAGFVSLDGLELDIEPRYFSPVLITSPEGRESRFPRALCNFRDRNSERRGVGWTEWNQPTQ